MAMLRVSQIVFESREQVINGSVLDWYIGPISKNR
jgi:hypothetical protein